MHGKSFKDRVVQHWREACGEGAAAVKNCHG